MGVFVCCEKQGRGLFALAGFLSVMFLNPLLLAGENLKKGPWPSSADHRRAVPNQLLIKFKDSYKGQKEQLLNAVELAIFSQSASRLSAQKNSERAVPKDLIRTMQAPGLRVIKEFKSEGALLLEWPDSTDFMESLAAAGFLRNLSAGVSHHLSNESSAPLDSHETSMAALEDAIEYVEPNYYVHHFGIPNDPDFNQQKGLYPSQTGEGGRNDIFVEKAWAFTVGAPSTVVGIIDTGVDYQHPDLKENIWHNPGEMGVDSKGRSKTSNGLDDDGNGFVDDFQGWDFANNDNDPMDDNGHGTHCAGTVGAKGDNGIGIAGINWRSSIYPIKFLDRRGFGTVAHSAMAIEYATAMGIPILNNSWGGDEYSETVAAAIRHAQEKNILFIVAAGNESNNNDIGPIYPASYDFQNVVSVAALDENNEVAGFSNFGPRSVALAAPGVAIWSTLPQGQYGPMEGTSMAAPFVTGAAALLKTMYPSLTFSQLKARLLATAIDHHLLKKQVFYGRLSLQRVLENQFQAPSVDEGIALKEVGRSFVLLSGLHQKRFHSYEVRWAPAPILNEVQWEKAVILKKEVLVSAPTRDSSKGSKNLADPQDVEISGFPLNAKGYLLARFWDDLGNLSDHWENLPFELKTLTLAYEAKPQDLRQIDLKGGWGIEEIPGRGLVFSDSPGGVYGYDRPNSFRLPSLSVATSEPVLTFDSKFEFEAGFDFGEIALSLDGGESWKVIKEYTGARGWMSEVVPLKRAVQSPDLRSILIRFQTRSDRTTSKDGWLISNIRLWH